MARIRTVKPDFYNDEKLSKISIQANFLYVGTWVFADDEAVIRQSPKWISSQIFPHRENISLNMIKKWLRELEKGVWLYPFEYNGEAYYYITTMRAHQRIDRPHKSKIPDEIIKKIVEDSTNARRMLDERSSLYSKSNSKGIVNVDVEEGSTTTEIPIDVMQEKKDPPLSAPPPLSENAAWEIEKCYNEYWTQRYGQTREVICMSKQIKMERLNEWSGAFNRFLISSGTTGKILKDYVSHFNNWLNKQNMNDNPNKLYESGTTKNGQPGKELNGDYKQYLASKMAGGTG